ncbi:MAG: sugar transferase, partial [Candidatus Latescibacterota bacterium]
EEKGGEGKGERGRGGEREHGSYPVLGNAEELPRIIEDYRIEEVLIAVDSSSHREILDMVSRCNGRSVTFGIIPDLYDIVSGHVRTQEIYGFPVMELLPDLMPAWEKKAKRLLDVVVSLVVLIGIAPVCALVALLIKLDSKGPILFTQKRVGKDGKIFTMGKFRSMVENAEQRSGPVWAEKDDPRITRIGRIIRRLKIDEVPQLFNVLRGDMSLVGPRPERPFFVESLEREIPLYRRRLRVAPGLTGWAQTKQGYDTSIDDVKEKLKYDLYYIENMSLRMDAKILLRTLFVALRGTEVG